MTLTQSGTPGPKPLTKWDLVEIEYPQNRNVVWSMKAQTRVKAQTWRSISALLKASTIYTVIRMLQERDQASMPSLM
jgi:hypothetical protein